MAKIPALVEAMMIPVITALAETYGDAAFQKLIDGDKAKAKIVLTSLSKTITAVAKRNKISLK